MSSEFIKKGSDLLSLSTPLVFADGTDTYKRIAERTVRHSAGYFILAPSGAGKTHYIENQKEHHWIDGDEIWMSAKAHPEGPWWLEGIAVTDEIDQRCDVITAQAKKLGFWIMGSSNYWLKPDAVVIPEWDVHRAFVSKREQENYDGGATSKDLDQLQVSRKWMSRWEKEGVTIFKSIEEAVASLV
jgi:hypothetical protein